MGIIFFYRYQPNGDVNVMENNCMPCSVQLVSQGNTMDDESLRNANCNQRKNCAERLTPVTQARYSDAYKRMNNIPVSMGKLLEQSLFKNAECNIMVFTASDGMRIVWCEESLSHHDW